MGSGEQGSLRLLQMGSFCSSVDRFLLAPLILIVAISLDASIAAVALAATAYYQAYGLMQPVWAIVSDRWGRVRTMRLALCLAGIAGLLSAAATGPTWLLCARAIAGGCFAAAVPGALIYVGDTVPAARRQAPMTDLMTGAAIGISVATAGAGVVGEYLHWRVALAAPAVLALFLATALRRVPEPDTGPRPSVYRSFALVLRHRWAVVVLALAACEGVLLVGLLTFLPLTLQFEGTSATVAGLVTAVYGLSVLACSRVVRRASARVAPARLIGVGASAGTAAYVALAIEKGIAGVLVGCVCLGAAWAFMHTTMQTWVTDVVPDARATAVSIFASLLFTGGAVGSAVGIACLEADRFRELLVVGGPAMAAVGLAAVAARRGYARRQAE